MRFDKFLVLRMTLLMSDVVARQTVPGGGTWLIGSSAGRARSAGWGWGARWGADIFLNAELLRG
jgi:hypothetical protein